MYKDLEPGKSVEGATWVEVYKDLEPGKSVEGATWVGRADAETEITASFARLKTEGH